MPKDCASCGAMNYVQAKTCSKCAAEFTDRATATATAAPEPTAPAKTSSSWGPLVAVAVVALIVWGVSQQGGDDDDATSPSSFRASSTVVYRISGSRTSSVDITVSTPGGGTSQQADIDVPMRNNSGAEGLRYTYAAGEFLYISAQRNDDNSGSITCEVEVNGIVVDENTSSGPYTIATCQGSA